jgi:hypothetical protein
MDFEIDRLLAHVKLLAEDYRHRHAGEHDQVLAARYIADQMRRASLQVHEIQTPILGWQVHGTPSLRVLEPDQRRLEFAPYVYSGSTPADGIEGVLVAVGHTLAGGAEPWRKFAVIESGAPDHWLGLIIGRTDGPAMGRRGTPAGSMVTADGPSWSWPSCVIGQEDTQAIESWLAQGITVRVNLTMRTEHKVNCPSVNVVGIVEGHTLPDEVVIMGVHHDAVGAIGYPESVDSAGANDNASGVAILLEMAAWYQSNGSTRTVWFCSFDGEERGLMGSSEFLRRTSESGELARVVAYVGVDQAAYGDTFWVLASSDEPHLSKGVDFTTISRSVIDELSLGELADFRGPVPLHAASDHWPFFYAGVPATLIGWHPFDGYHRGGDTYDRCVHDDQFLTCAKTTDALLTKVLELPRIGRQRRPLSAGFVVNPPNIDSLGVSVRPKASH